jgi:hypothetical protein
MPKRNIDLLMRSISTDETPHAWIKRELNELTERFTGQFGHHKNGAATKNSALTLVMDVIHSKLVGLVEMEDEDIL